MASKQVKVAEGAGSAKHGRADVRNSSGVFAKLAAEQLAAAAAKAKGDAGGGKQARALQQAQGTKPTAGATAFKL